MGWLKLKGHITQTVSNLVACAVHVKFLGMLNKQIH